MEKTVAGFAHRPDDIGARTIVGIFAVAADARNRMNCPVESRAHQIVHCRVDHHERLAAILLHVKNPCEQHTGGTDNRTARLQQKMQTQWAYSSRDHPRIRLARRNFFVGVAHAQAAAEIQVLQRDSCFAQLPNVNGQSA